MDFIKKNKFIIIGILVIIAAVGGYFVFTSGKTQTKLSVTEEQNVKQINPSEIGLELSLRPDKKAVIIKATKIDGVESLEYELTYDAEVTEEGETVNVPRGAVGELKIRSGLAEAEVDLGTCSANVCKYDKVTSQIKVVIKVSYSNGEIGSVEDTISLGEE